MSESAKRKPGDVFERHRGPITCVAGIPGRQAAVSSGYDSAVGWVDLERGKISLLGYHRHLVNRIVVSPSGKLAASCSSDYTVCLWNLESLEPVKVLQGHWDDVEDFAFVDDSIGISVSRDRRIFVWNLETGTVLRSLEKHVRDVLSVEFAAGKIYSSGDDMTLRQWDLQSGELLRTWGPFDVETDTCAIDPIHQRVVLGCDDGCIRIFDCNSGAALREIKAHASGIKKVAVSPQNGDILSAAYDQRILVWDASTFELKQELVRHAATWERSFNWSPDGLSVLAGTFDGTVLRWNAGSGERLPEIGVDILPIGNACLNDVSADGKGLVATVSDDGYLRIARLAEQEAAWIETIEAESGRILMNAVCLVAMKNQPVGEHLVLAGSHDQKLHSFRFHKGTLQHQHELMLGQGPVNCIRCIVNDDGSLEAFVACYSGAVVRVSLDAEANCQILQTLPLHHGAVKSVRMNPAGRWAASGAADGSLLAWNVDGQITRRFIGHTAIVDDLDFDPSGQFLASVSRDFTLKVYHYETGVTLHSMLLGRESPKCVLFWDSETVLVGNYWGDVWRVDLGSEAISAHRLAINGISSIARSGSHCVIAAYDGSVCLLDPADMSVIARLHCMHQKLPEYEERASFDRSR